VEEFKYLGTNLTNQNPIQEEIKSRLKSGIVCSHSVQNLLPSSLLSKKIQMKIYYDFTCCFVWVCNLVAHIEEGTLAEGV
jgi:hypothetical protein